MSAVFACEKTHICPWANPGLLAGRPGSADKKTRVFFCATPGGLSRHVIPALTCAEARKSTIRRSQSMPAAIYYRPFFLIRNRRFDTSQRAKESRPTSRAYRTWRPPLPHVGRASAPNPVSLWPSRTRCPLLSLPFLTAYSRPCRHRGSASVE